MNHTVYFPSVDEGVDIVLGNGLKLQVKCGRYHNDPRTSGRYHILAPGRVKKYQKGRDRDERRSYAGVVDFVVYWAIEENRFFVFPAGSLTSGVWIPSKLDTFKNLAKKTKTFSAPLVREYEEAWHLLDVDAAVESIDNQVTAAVKNEGEI